LGGSNRVVADGVLRCNPVHLHLRPTPKQRHGTATLSQFVACSSTN
jgi:hypothetical protein